MYIHKGPTLYLAADRETVVEEGDVRAAFVLIADGGSLSDEEAKRYGLTERKSKADAPEEKAKADPTANKARAEPPTNKGK